jgi:hypothetical protein
MRPFIDRLGQCKNPEELREIGRTLRAFCTYKSYELRCILDGDPKMAEVYRKKCEDLRNQLPTYLRL